MKVSLAIITTITLVTGILGGTTIGSDAILIDFVSQHCAHCLAMEPVLAELERNGVPVRRVDVDRESQLAMRHGIRQTPTIVVMSAGKELTRFVGTRTAAEIREALSLPTHGPLTPTAANSQSLDQLASPRTRLAPVGATANLQKQNEVMPSRALADAVQRAEAATVRLKIFDGHGYGAGTGTIIDTHGDEALVLTCGHLFRDTKGQGKIEVELFVGGDVRKVEGQLVDYDAADRDIALVAIRPGVPIHPIQVIGAGEKLQNGQSVFSFGCDRGDDPSRRDTRITAIDKYNQHLGVSNLEIAGAPIDGRSGGGLFDESGRLIGVCNAADYKSDIGIYAGPGTIHWQLDRTNLSALYQRAVRDREAVAASLAGPVNLGSADSPEGPERLASLADVAPASVNPSDQEIIVIVRDRTSARPSDRVMTIAHPSRDLLQMIERHVR
jgi:thiol-disulfide isomerase/thioredoxin